MGDDERVAMGRESRRAPGAEEVFGEEENSQNYEGAALRELRAQRPIERRVEKLEEKHDAVVEIISEVRGDVKGMAGKLDTFMAMQPRQHTEDSLMRVVKDTTTTTLATRVLDEQRDTKNFRRQFVLSTLKIVAGLASAGALGAIAHYLLAKL